MKFEKKESGEKENFSPSDFINKELPCLLTQTSESLINASFFCEKASKRLEKMAEKYRNRELSQNHKNEENEENVEPNSQQEKAKIPRH